MTSFWHIRDQNTFFSAYFPSFESSHVLIVLLYPSLACLRQDLKWSGSHRRRLQTQKYYVHIKLNLSSKSYNVWKTVGQTLETPCHLWKTFYSRNSSANIPRQPFTRAGQENTKPVTLPHTAGRFCSFSIKDLRLCTERLVKGPSRSFFCPLRLYCSVDLGFWGWRSFRGL